MSTNYPPPPPPARLIKNYPAPDEATRVNLPAPRSTKIPRSTNITLRWDTILTVVASFVVGGAVALAVALPITTHLGAVNEDVPWCTAPIADAGGTCHGEPLSACPTEDSTNCYWDASRGNGLGRSFVDVDGTVHYQEVTP